jgi:hypothetical protein
VRSKLLGAAVLVMFGCREGGCRITDAEVVDVLAVSFCEARWSAGCEHPGISQTECESHLRRVGEDVRDEAHALGLEFDEDCAQEHRDRYEQQDGFEPLAFGEKRCALWVGHGREGDACETSSGLTTCAPGLRCSTMSVCEVEESPLEIGADCVDYVVYRCEDGLACVDGVCAPTPEIGQHCYDTCVDGAYCDDEVCVENPGLGMSCGIGTPSGCAAQLACEDNVCVEAPPAICGEPTPWPW